MSCPRLSGRAAAALALAAGLAALAGCQPATETAGTPTTTPPPPVAAAPADPTTFPPLGQRQRVKQGVVLYEQVVGQGVTATRVGVYLPELPPEGKLPCVLIAPAGTPLIHGMNLSPRDQAEHVPYVRAGFAVVAYSLSGPVPPHADEGRKVEAVRGFMQADGGLVNARTALDYALARVGKIDPERVYAAGNSSAATLALLVAEHDPRVKGCVAFAPVTDVPAALGPQGIDQVARQVPGFKEFVERSSPRAHLAKLQCPVFLFHAKNDRTVPVAESVNFANELKKTNPKVKLVTPPTGTLKQGIPLGIGWLKGLAKG
jgi:dipeptidyl aminopeptidase/acylaminoacyl peptidase